MADFLAIAGDGVEQFVAVHDLAGGVAHHQAIAVAVQGDADVGAMLAYRTRQAFSVGGAAFLVDIHAVGLRWRWPMASAPNSWNTCGRCDNRRRWRSHHDAHAAQIHVGGEGALAELDVAAGRVVQPLDLAQLPGKAVFIGCSSAASIDISTSSGSLARARRRT